MWMLQVSRKGWWPGMRANPRLLLAFGMAPPIKKAPVKKDWGFSFVPFPQEGGGIFLPLDFYLNKR